MARMHRLAALLGAVALASSLLLAPAWAAEPEAPATSTVQQDSEGRITIADTPRDRVGLLFLGALGAATAFAIAGMRRQLRGQHPSAEGGFRWR